MDTRTRSTSAAMPTIKIVRKVRGVLFRVDGKIGTVDWSRSGRGSLRGVKGGRGGGREVGMEERSVSANTVFFSFRVDGYSHVHTGSVTEHVSAFTRRCPRRLRDPLILSRDDASLRYRCVLLLCIYSPRRDGK